MAGWPDGIDMDALLAPFEGDSPTGIDLREDFSPQSAYYRLRDARAEARAAERAADGNPGEETAMPVQWRAVRDLALTALTTKTKDLEIAAWLTEALVRSDGLRGLAAGAHLISGLTAFWDDTLYPMPDEDGISTRVAPVGGLNGEGGGGTLFQPLLKLPLFPRPAGGSMALWQYQQSEKLAAESDSERIEQRLAAGILPLEGAEAEARSAGQAHFARMKESALLASEEWRLMGEALDARAGYDSPPTSGVRDVLEQITTLVSRFAPAEEAASDEPEAYAGAVSEDGTVAVGGGGVARAPALNREDMLKELVRIAEYFRKTEPQSPLAYTLDEAVRRGRMTWPELLAEVVQDSSLRENILMQLGIRPQE